MEGEQGRDAWEEREGWQEREGRKAFGLRSLFEEGKGE